MIKKTIRRRECKEETQQLFNQQHPLLRRIYAARKISSERELKLDFDHLLSYDLLKGIHEAAELLAQSIMQNKKIVIVGDFDADGATSTALAIRALKSFGAEQVAYLVPNRFSFGYGLTPELIEAGRSLSPDVIVTVDNGIANHAGVDAAKALGIKVIITDHHLPSATLPLADAIVNPNQPDDHFPSKNLAGVGVIFYVMLAVRRCLKQQAWFEKQNRTEPNMSRLLDLVALGTVADVVALDHNNRILIHHGLKRIRALQCIPGIIALLELSNRELTRVSESDLGFVVASRLNAAGRLDDMSLGIECLLSDDSIKVREIARTLNQLNDERRYIEKEMQAQALSGLARLHMDQKQDMPRGLCLYDESWHQGVIGILASRIKDKFNRPVVVFAKGGEGELKGSARSISCLHIRDALARISAIHPNLILKFGGHAMAAGLTISENTFPNFVKIFNEVVSAQISEQELEHCLLSDGGLHSDELNLDIANMIKEAGPWGQAFPEPLFDDVFQILEQRIVGDKHLKLRLAKNDTILDAIAFFIDMKDWPNHRCQFVRVGYRLDVNEYKGNRKVQLIVEYLEPANVSSV